MITEPYPLDNDHALASDHHDALAELLDPVTIARLKGLRPDWTGAACLEVGAGGGSIARYLAEQVSTLGRVVALDIKPRHIPSHPQLTVVQHDLTSDDPLPTGPWDLIHARLVLVHLPQRDAILKRLIAALAPGGVLLTEDWEGRVSDIVVAAPSREAAELHERYQSTAMCKVFGKAGTDRLFGRRANLALRRAGLVNVETTVNAEYWIGGGAGCRLVHATTYELEPQLVETGITREELARLRTFLSDPRMIIFGHPLYSTSGWRPVDGDLAPATGVESIYEVGSGQ